MYFLVFFFLFDSIQNLSDRMFLISDSNPEPPAPKEPEEEKSRTRLESLIIIFATLCIKSIIILVKKYFGVY